MVRPRSDDLGLPCMIGSMTVPAWLAITLFILACYRVTRFLVYDQWPPLVRFRRVVTKDRPSRTSALSYLLGTSETYGCPWCMSIWVCGVATLGLGLYVALGLHTSWTPWYGWVALWLAASAACGFLGNKDEP